MRWDQVNGVYILDSGRTLDANQAIVGINPDLDTYEGYDGGFGPDASAIEYCGEKPLTKDERDEIARFMIDLWTKWAVIDDQRHD
jgi:hypothetical protein